MPAKPDLTIIQQAKAKDRKAQAALMERYWPSVYHFMLLKTGEHTLADELTVAAFSKALQKLDLYDPTFDFTTWLLTIAQNNYIDHWRRAGRQNEELTDRLHLDHASQGTAESPEESLIAKEDNERVLALINSMEQKYRDIIRLRFFEEKSLRQIAEELNITMANVKVRVMRAKLLLSELLREDTDAPNKQDNT